MTCPDPEDFIRDFSPLQPAELLHYVVHESAGGAFGRLVRDLRTNLTGSYRRNKNDEEVERAWHVMIDQWGDTSPDTIIRFLSEKFAHTDHLRKFEYAFLARCLVHLSVHEGVLVDMGGGRSYSTVVPLLFGLPDVEVISVDVSNQKTESKFNVRYVGGDCMYTYLPNESVDIVTLISTLEHVGLGRWGDPLHVDGDILAMREVRRILKPNGHLILTVPYGFPTVVFNVHRIYDEGRLSLLTKGFNRVLAGYTLHGKICEKQDIEGKKASYHIPGFYEDLADSLLMPNAQGGILLLLERT